MAHNDSFKIWDWMGSVELKGAIEKLLEKLLELNNY